MSLSLSDLIYGKGKDDNKSSESRDNENLDFPKALNDLFGNKFKKKKSTQQKPDRVPSKHKSNGYEDFYDSVNNGGDSLDFLGKKASPMKRKSRAKDNESKKLIDSKQKSKSTPLPTSSSTSKTYDFEKVDEERRFFAKKGSSYDVNSNTNFHRITNYGQQYTEDGMRVPRRYRVFIPDTDRLYKYEYDFANEQEKKEWQAYVLKKKKIRARFRHEKKFDLTNEIDHGGAVTEFISACIQREKENSIQKQENIPMDDTLHNDKGKPHETEKTQHSFEDKDASGMIKEETINHNISLDVGSQTPFSMSITGTKQMKVNKIETYCDGDEEDEEQNHIHVKKKVKFSDAVGKDSQSLEQIESLDTSITNNDNEKINALGSLIDRVEKEEAEAHRSHPYVKREMDSKNPMQFLKEGLSAPKKLKFNYCTAPKFVKEQSPKRLKVDDHILTSHSASKRSPLEIFDNHIKLSKNDQNFNSNNGSRRMKSDIYYPHARPLSRFDPSVRRAQFPLNRDVFYTYPIKSKIDARCGPQHNIAANGQSLLSTTFPRYRTCKSMYDRKMLPVDFHSRCISKLVARHVVGRSISGDSTTADLLELLHRKPSSIRRNRFLFRVTAEFASNKVFWDFIQPKVTKLRHHIENQQTKVPLSKQNPNPTCSKAKDDYKLAINLSAIEREFNSGDTGISVDPDIPPGSETCEKYSNTRKNAYKYINQEFQKRFEPIDTEKVMSNQGAVENPWDQSFILSKCDQLDLSTSPNEMCTNDVFATVGHRSVLDQSNAWITLGAILSELNMKYSLASHASQNIHESSFHNLLEVHKIAVEYMDEMFENIIPSILPPLQLQCSAPLAQVALARQSLVANVGLTKIEDNENGSKPIHSGKTNHYLSDSDDDIKSNISSTSLNSSEDGQTNDHDKDFNLKIDFSKIANKLVQFGKPRLMDSRLDIFPELHITTGIAILASTLPPSAAEIISRPLLTTSENASRRTPFDLSRVTLEAIEASGMVMRNSMNDINNYSRHAKYSFSQSYNLSQNSISQCKYTVKRLLDGFDSAIGIFQRVHAMRPNVIRNSAWLVAINLMKLCFASGNVAGDGATIARPASYIVNEIIEMDDATDNQSNSRYLNRSRHLDYSRIRAAASSAFRDFLHQCRNEYKSNDFSSITSNSHIHLYMLSLLEWREAICLLYYRPKHNMQYFTVIDKMHTFHLMHWSLKEKTSFAFQVLVELVQSGKVSKNILTIALASQIEQKPNDIELWGYLASQLGPVGKALEGKEQLRCLKKSCSQCMRLYRGCYSSMGNEKSMEHEKMNITRKGLFIDHKAKKKARKKGTWWGLGRTQFWDHYFFHFPASVHYGLRFEMANFAYDVCKLIRKAVNEQEFVPHNEAYKKSKKVSSNTDIIEIDDPYPLNEFWLCSTIESDRDEEDLDQDDDDHQSVTQECINIKLKFRQYDDLLPKYTDIHSYSNIGYNPGHNITLDVDKNKNGDYCKILCYKALVACHLYSTCHPFVTNTVWSLAKRSCGFFNASRTVSEVFLNSEEFISLKWLAMQGLNINQILCDAFHEFANSNDHSYDHVMPDHRDNSFLKPF